MNNISVSFRLVHWLSSSWNYCYLIFCHLKLFFHVKIPFSHLMHFETFSGTSQSVWANGTLPSIAGTSGALVACVRKEDSCCSDSWLIRVRKCKIDSHEFLLYKLPPTPRCPMSYCAGRNESSLDIRYSVFFIIFTLQKAVFYFLKLFVSILSFIRFRSSMSSW